MPSAFKSIGDDEFEAVVLRSPTPVIVFFWAPSSDACRIFIPAIESLAAERPDDATLVKVNVDQHREAARQARLGALPALLLYRGGEVAAELIGTCTRDEAVAFWDQARGSGAAA